MSHDKKKKDRHGQRKMQFFHDALLINRFEVILAFLKITDKVIFAGFVPPSRRHNLTSFI
jgi:hypothetical protein